MDKKTIKKEKTVIVEEEIYMIDFEELKIIYWTFLECQNVFPHHSDKFLKLFEEIQNMFFLDK